MTCTFERKNERKKNRVSYVRTENDDDKSEQASFRIHVIDGRARGLNDSESVKPRTRQGCWRIFVHAVFVFYSSIRCTRFTPRHRHETRRAILILREFNWFCCFSRLKNQTFEAIEGTSFPSRRRVARCFWQSDTRTRHAHRRYNGYLYKSRRFPSHSSAGPATDRDVSL